MSNISEIWNLSALCRCCHTDGVFRSINEQHAYKNGMEVYSVMLFDTLNLKIMSPPIEASYAICDECIVRLRDAWRFKQQVISCEQKFAEYCENEIGSRLSRVGDDDVKTEYEDVDEIGSRLSRVGDDDVKTEYEDEDELGSRLSRVGDDDVKTEYEDEDIMPDHTAKIEKSDFNCTDVEVKDYQQEIKLEGDVNSEEKAKEGKTAGGKSKTEQLKTKRIGKKAVRKNQSKPKCDPSLIVYVKTGAADLYSCKICQGSYSDYKDIERHVIKNHTGERSKCDHCEKTYRTKAACDNHVKIVHQQKRYACSICQKVFGTLYTLKEHHNKHSQVRNYTCDICTKKFTYKCSLRVHINKHLGLWKKRICHLCGLSFNDTTNLSIHIQTVHEKMRPFPCELCPKTYSAKKHLLLHMLRHKGEKRFKCDKCGKSYYTQTELKCHGCFASGKVYTCKVCEIEFKDRGTFARHTRRSHVGHKPHVCPVCGKDFTCKYSMRRHEALHAEDRPFKCDLCPLKFKQKCSLGRHLKRLHSDPNNSKTEKCDVCNKLVFNLNQHMKCHDEKRFFCDLCDKSYSVNNALNRHKKSEHSDCSVVCKICNKKYLNVKTLKKHQKMAHSVVKEELDSRNATFNVDLEKIENSDSG